MSAKVYLVGSALVIFVVGMLVAHLQEQKAARVRERIEEVEMSIQDVVLELDEVEKLKLDLEKRQEDSKAASARVLATDEEEIKSPGHVAYSSEFEAWLDRIDRLSEYLSLNNKYEIPEMQYLTEQDWLDATKDFDLQSEAHYRHGLAELRKLAQIKVAPRLSKSLVDYIQANDGARPTNVFQLSKFLPDGIDPKVFEGYRIGSPDPASRASKASKFSIESKRGPDSLFNSIVSFNDKRGIVIKGPPDLERFEKAIAGFERDTGRPPESSEELAPYIKSNEDESVIREKFRAWNTPVKLPSQGG